MEPEILLGRLSYLALEPRREIGGERCDIRFEIAGSFDVYSLTRNFVTHLFSRQSPRDAGENGRIQT
jgi:hypothetical protein